jgi:hypothetical protein
MHWNRDMRADEVIVVLFGILVILPLFVVFMTCMACTVHGSDRS